MESHITIKEAIEITGKSESSIRRFLRNISEADKQAHTIKTGKYLLINREWLLSELGPDYISNQRKTQSEKNQIQLLTHIDRQRQTIDDLNNVCQSMSNQVNNLHGQLADKDETIKELVAKLLQLQTDILLLERKANSLKEEPGMDTQRAIIWAVIILCLLALLYIVFGN